MTTDTMYVLTYCDEGLGWCDMTLHTDLRTALIQVLDYAGFDDGACLDTRDTISLRMAMDDLNNHLTDYQIGYAEGTRADLLACLGRAHGDYVWLETAQPGDTTRSDQTDPTLAQKPYDPEPTQIIVESDDYGGLRFVGSKAQLLQTAQDMRAAVQDAGSMPNYLSDFIFGLEVRCQELGLMTEDFDATGGAA